MINREPVFLIGRRCPSDQFKGSIAWVLDGKGLKDDAAFVQQLDRDDPRVFSLFGINNAVRNQDRTAGFTPGPCQAEYLARLQEVEHTPTDTLSGLIAVGIEDLARAHAIQLRATGRRSERSSKATRVRPLTHHGSVA